MSSLILFANNASSTLAGAITSAATSMNLAAGTGAEFPNPSAGQFFCVTLNDAATGQQTEIMHCTVRVGDVLAGLTRAQEGTTAQNWNAGDLVDAFVTAGGLQAMDQTGATPGKLLSTQVFGAGTVTPTYPAGTNTVVIELQAGGGSGGGVAGPDGSHAAVGSSAGAGAYIQAQMAIATATGQSLVVGAGAAAPSAGAHSGTAGGDSSFGGTLIACPGGTAGITQSQQVGPATIGSGGHATGSVGAGVTLIKSIPGQTGFGGIILNATTPASGFGGSSAFGPGGESAINGNGGPGLGAGSGGSGAGVPASGADAAGGPGKDGTAIVRSYS